MKHETKMELSPLVALKSESLGYFLSRKKRQIRYKKELKCSSEVDSEVCRCVLVTFCYAYSLW